MVSGLKYRALSVIGAVLGSASAVLLSNQPTVQRFSTEFVPVFNRLPAAVLTGAEFRLALISTISITVASLFPLFKPRPRRILDTIFLTQKRVVVATLALATIGYFDYTYRLPRSTLVLLMAVLLVSLPVWFVGIRNRPANEKRAIIVGDDIHRIQEAYEVIDISVVGYVSLRGYQNHAAESVPERVAVTDGSGSASVDGLNYLGGVSRLNEMLIQHDIDTVILAFSKSDRAEFFGVLNTCYEHGVEAKIQREHAESVLISTASSESTLVDIDLEPWDWQDYVLKRAFDIGFATVGIVSFMPVIIVIALILKFDSGSPVLYSQERTAEFGDTFTVYKFRTMSLEPESAVPKEDENNDRITQVGQILRRTHLDELPQLWSILWGEMSVVGPRAVWTDEEQFLEMTTKMWRMRWFVKPGLTGLAQINDVKSTEPAKKLRYDLEYIQNQSFWLDVKIVIRQIWAVLSEISRQFLKERSSSR
ncbi:MULTISPECIES: sugar transferase [Halorussus]|uniref:sugar transferase n=1 Tax=Halorussus TaxID=1070314 RepID=UPI0020A09FD0|nr:sugar transferase [Halorussus vallis]USZ77387.1 sugar transferase [Halorussus vallis]